MNQITTKDEEILEEMKQGVCPMCGGDVALGHCMSCGEPVDAISEEEYETDNQ